MSDDKLAKSASAENTPATAEGDTPTATANVQVPTETSLGIGHSFEYEVPQVLAFPRCYVDKYPDHTLRWLDQIIREEEGMDYWEPVPHDPKVDFTFPGPNNTVRRGTMFLGYRPKLITQKRTEKYAEIHASKLKRARMKDEHEVDFEDALGDGNTRAHFEHEEGKEQKLKEMKEFFKIQKELGLDDNE